jgi:hypothetical protein
MKTRISAFAALLALALPVHSFAHGKAKPLVAPLVQNRAECTAPDTVTSTGRPACTSLAAVDEACSLGHDGTGFIEAVVKGEGIRVKAALKHLSETCEGAVLSVAFRVRTTTHCPSEHCTLADEDLVGTATCTVSKGKCTIRDTIPTGMPAGDHSGLQVLSCGIRNGQVQTFSCGMLIP